MKIYDWIVVGAGITGAALAYELVNKGCKVLLLEQYATPHNATRYSYGGLAFWSGTTPLTRQLCDEGWVTTIEKSAKRVSAAPLLGASGSLWELPP